MISIRKAASELERLEASLRLVTEVYENAIFSIAQYVVEVNPADAQRFRHNLDRIRAHIPRSTSEEQWRKTQSEFRGELRAYRDKATERVEELHGEIRKAAEAMQAFAESVASSGTGHEKEIRNSLADLDRAAQCDSITEVHCIVADARESIAGSIEQMTQRHQLVIAVLRDEVRVLHEHIEAERRSTNLDAVTGVLNRAALDAHILVLLETGQPFHLLLVHVRNLKRATERYTQEVLQESLQALLGRLTEIVGETPNIGRWNNDSFAAVLTSNPTESIRMSREISRRLSGIYTVQVNGSTQNVSFDVIAGVIDRATGSHMQSFYKKLLQMSEALGVA